MNKEQLEVLETASEYIVKLIDGMYETVNYFQSDKEKQGLEMIPLLGDGIAYIIDVITVLPLDIDSSVVININTQLAELIQGLEYCDYVLVSDILNYEIIPIFNNVKEGMSCIIEKQDKSEDKSNKEDVDYVTFTGH